jgi:hypothetical protein
MGIQVMQTTNPLSVKTASVVVLSAFALCFSLTAFPCTVPPPPLFRDHASLLGEATRIVIVEVIADQAARGKNCKLRLIKTLKGSDVNDGLDVQCRILGKGDWMTDFSSHSEDLFWKQRSGRVGISSACTPTAPAFEIGKKYLLVLGVQPDTKQFEEVASASDKWLEFAEQVLAKSKLR